MPGPAALLLGTNTGSLVHGADTAALLPAAGVNLATVELAGPSAAPECCIAGADRQPSPRRTPRFLAFQLDTLELDDEANWP